MNEKNFLILTGKSGEKIRLLSEHLFYYSYSIQEKGTICLVKNIVQPLVFRESPEMIDFALSQLNYKFTKVETTKEN